MKIQTKYADGMLLVYLSGELDHHTAKTILTEIENALNRYLPRQCVLDLTGLRFMDSSGIAVILRLQRQMKQMEGEMWIIHPGSQPGRVLDASGIDGIVQVKTLESEKSK